MSATPRLTCEQCGKPIVGSGGITAIEVIVQRDGSGRVTGTMDGYHVVFHEACWSDLQARRVYSARTFRRPRPRS